MTIIRTAHDKKNPYVVINKHVLGIESLSWEAKGLWSYLLSRPDSWEVSVTHLVKNFPSGRDKVWRLLRELISHNLCVKSENRSSGRFQGVDYTVYEFPQEQAPCTENQQSTLPCTEKPCTVKPSSVKQTPISNEASEQVTKETKRKRSISKDIDVERSAAASPPPQSKVIFLDKPREGTIQVRDNLYLTPEELEKILEWNDGDEDISKAMLDKVDWLHQTILEGTSKRKKPYTMSVFSAPWLRQAAAEDASRQKTSRPSKDVFKAKVQRSFKHGCTYNGAEYTEDEKGCGFMRGMNQRQMYWNSRDFEQAFFGMLANFNISFNSEPQDVRKRPDGFKTMDVISSLANGKRN